jgi:hypothetical protein
VSKDKNKFRRFDDFDDGFDEDKEEYRRIKINKNNIHDFIEDDDIEDRN